MALTNFYCSRCRAAYPPNELYQLCSKCGGILYARYDYDKIRQYLKPRDLLTRNTSIWRYKELLPLVDESNIVSKGEGFSPVLALKRSGSHIGLPGLFMKDESTQPCGTFKSRNCSVTVSANREWAGKTMIVCADAPEALAWSCYAAAAGLPMVVLTLASELPEHFEQAILSTGATLYAFDGDIALAVNLAERTANANGWLHVSLFYEPYGLEGKKTIGFEIAEQFEWKLPDVIVSMVDYSGVFGGVYRALYDLRQMQWFEGAMPRLVAVQTEDDSDLAQAWLARKASMLPPKSKDPTEKSAINQRLEFLNHLGGIILDGIYKTLGCAVIVSKNEILEASKTLGGMEGILAGEAAGGVMAAAAKLFREGWITAKENVLLINPNAGSFRPPANENQRMKTITLAEDMPVLPAE